MSLEKYKNKNVCIELKNGSKYFGVIIDIDESPINWNWIILQEKNRKNPQMFSDSEIARVEVLE